MLRNIIFDMGGVLTEFDPEYFVGTLDLEEKGDAELLLNEIFRSEDWKLNDLGEIEESELEKRVFSRLPERLHAAAHRMIYEWDQISRPIEGMAELVRDCRAAGLGVYLLSNASVRQPEYWPSIPGSEYFDGTCVSAFYRLLKPSKEIFQLAIEKFSLKAEECLFVDDMKVNADGAIAAGLMGFHFTGDADALREAIRGLGVPVSVRED